MTQPSCFCRAHWLPSSRSHLGQTPVTLDLTRIRQRRARSQGWLPARTLTHGPSGEFSLFHLAAGLSPRDRIGRWNRRLLHGAGGPQHQLSSLDLTCSTPSHATSGRAWPDHSQRTVMALRKAELTPRDLPGWAVCWGRGSAKSPAVIALAPEAAGCHG